MPNRFIKIMKKYILSTYGFGPFILYLLVVSNLTFYLFEVLFVNFR